MQESDITVIDSNEDLSQILPIQQKRTIAFINHFIMQTVSYLNNFAQSCESRFMEFEYKIQKIESSLLILESQLSSIDGLDKNKITNEYVKIEQPTDQKDLMDIKVTPTGECEVEIMDDGNLNAVQGIKAKNDIRYQKFFKMLHVGVPEPAIRLKMQNEGIDPNILDQPDKIMSFMEES